jgi:U3 small nucleolar RNA-associated protein 3
MGRKRNTAKTGDKAVYASRGNRNSNDAEKHVDNDDMYNEIDRYNNARDELQDDVLNFNQNDDESEEGGIQNDVENVFDLGIGKSDDESTTTSGSSSQDDGSIGQEEGMHDESLEDDEVSDDESSIEEMDDIPKTDLLNWGKRKKDYYNGDTADLEIGQEIEDAELEEEAGKEILKARLDGMTEQDFMLDDEDEDDESQQDKNIDKKDDKVEITDAMHSSKRRKLNKLSKSEKVKLMSKNHPELIPLISHFREEFIRPCAKETLVVLNALTQDPSNAEVSRFCHIQ